MRNNPNTRSRFKLSLNVEKHEGTGRLEAFSDGIFGIAATLLVIEIKIPPRMADSAQFVDALIRQWPAYMSYAASFIYLGIYWAHHLYIFRHFKRVDHVFLKLNILFLMMIAFIPFPTAVLGEHLHLNDERQRIATLVYIGTLIVTSALFLALWLYGTNKHRLVEESLPHDFIASTRQRYTAGPIAYIFCFFIALWYPTTSLVMVLLISFFYFLPFRMTQ